MYNYKYKIGDEASKSVEFNRFIANLPMEFESKGEVIYDGRNCIKKLSVSGLDFIGIKEVVVKCYHKQIFFQRIDSSFIRGSKAQRSFEHGEIMLQRAISTPLPLAYAEVWKYGLFQYGYYVCAWDDGLPLKSAIEDDINLCQQYARFVTHMHECGIVHGDLNLGNTLYKRCDNGAEGVKFSLIDINRSCIYKDSATLKQCLKDFLTFSPSQEVFNYFIREYSRVRNWNEKSTEEYLLQKKHCHDISYRNRKKILKPFRSVYYKMLE